MYFRRLSVVGACLLISVGGLFAQAPSAATTSSVWSDVNERAMIAARGAATAAAVRVILRGARLYPLTYRTVQLNRPALEALLKVAPPQFSVPASVYSLEIDVPRPYGPFSRFRIEESPIMEPGLAARYPEIRTYVGQGIGSDPTASMRIDVTPRGFHAIVLSARGQYYIDPYWNDSDATYISYYKRNFVAPGKHLICEVLGRESRAEDVLNRPPIAERPTGASLRIYRLALAATAEYMAGPSGTTPSTVRRRSPPWSLRSIGAPRFTSATSRFVMSSSTTPTS